MRIDSLQSRRPTRRARRVWGAIVAVIAGGLVAVGYGTAHWRAGVIDRDLRDRLLGQATALARTINANQIGDFTYTAADRLRPQFQRMGEQMRAYRMVADCRGIYTLARRGEALVFGPESYALDDPQASPPGTVYARPTAALRALFETPKAFVEGPVTDEYGTFVSAFAPVLDPLTGRVVMAIGLDVEAADWLAALARERRNTWICVGVLGLMFGAGVGVLRWREQLPNHRKTRLRYVEAGIVTVIGLSLTAGLVLAALDSETRSRRRVFQQLAEAHGTHIVDAFLNLRNHQLSALTRFCQGAGEISRDEFRNFAGPIVREGSIQAIQALAWIPVVPAAARIDFEAAARAGGLTDFHFWQRSADGRKESAEPRAAYFPIWLTEPLTGNETVLGFDNGSEPARTAAMTEALHANLPTVADPVFLLTGPEKSVGLLVYQPVFSPGPQRDLRGYALVVLRADSFLRAGLSSQPFDDASAHVDLYQIQAGEPPQHLAPSTHRAGAGPASRSPVSARIHPEISDSAVFPIFVFGKSYSLVFQPGAAFLAAYPSRAGWETALWGILLTTALSAYAGYLVRHRAGLEAHTAELRTTLYSIGDAVITTDTLGRVRKMNPVAEHLTGWSEAEAVGQPLGAVFHPIDESTRRPIADPVEDVLRDGNRAGFGHRTRLLARDGTERPIADNAAPIRDELGAVTGIVLTFGDQSARRAAEQLLRDTEERYRALFAQSLDGVFLHDWQGRFLDANEAALALVGYTREEMFARDITAVVAGENDLAAVAAAIELLRSTGRQETPIETRLRRKDGRVVWVELVGSLVCKDGKPFAVQGVARDITARKLAEQTLRASLAEKEVLLMEVHHRVKNNLQVIASLLRLESGRSEHPATRATLQGMRDRIHSMALLHETICRSDNLAEVDLASYLKQLAGQLLRSLAVDPGAIQLRLDLAATRVDIDQAVTGGLLVNELLANALQHGFPGGRTGVVTLELQPVDDAGRRRLRVSDSGIGLPPDFEALQKKSLGLQLVSDLARQLGGKLEIGPGGGASLQVVFLPKRAGMAAGCFATQPPGESSAMHPQPR